MNRNDIDITEQLKREQGHVLYRGSEGLIVTRADEDTLLTNIMDGGRLCEIIRGLHLPNFEQIVVKSTAVGEAVIREFGFGTGLPCTQWVYDKAEPPAYPPGDVRPLPMELAPLAARHYRPQHNTEPYIRSRIEAGRMWGLFEHGDLAGFIGMHDEGAMGLLEILPAYRRRGYGFLLEAYLIDWHLKQGFVPYCHVIDGNEASIRLQTKLGFVCAAQPAIWLWKE